MKIKFKAYAEIKPMEWVYIAILAVIVCLINSGRMEDAMQFLKDCLPMMTK
jgi:hypothetical protein